MSLSLATEGLNVSDNDDKLKSTIEDNNLNNSWSDYHDSEYHQYTDSTWLKDQTDWSNSWNEASQWSEEDWANWKPYKSNNLALALKNIENQFIYKREDIEMSPRFGTAEVSREWFNSQTTAKESPFEVDTTEPSEAEERMRGSFGPSKMQPNLEFEADSIDTRRPTSMSEFSRTYRRTVELGFTDSTLLDIENNKVNVLGEPILPDDVKLRQENIKDIEQVTKSVPILEMNNKDNNMNNNHGIDQNIVPSSLVSEVQSELTTFGKGGKKKDGRTSATLKDGKKGKELLRKSVSTVLIKGKIKGHFDKSSDKSKRGKGSEKKGKSKTESGKLKNGNAEPSELKEKGKMENGKLQNGDKPSELKGKGKMGIGFAKIDSVQRSSQRSSTQRPDSPKHGSMVGLIQVPDSNRLEPKKSIIDSGTRTSERKSTEMREKSKKSILSS